MYKKEISQMAKKRRGKKKPTVITLTLPDEGGIQQTGSLLIQRGDLAKVFQFHYCNAGDITSAIKDATKALVSLEKFPPVIPEASKDKSSAKGRAKKKAAPAPKGDEPRAIGFKSLVIAYTLHHLPHTR